MKKIWFLFQNIFHMKKNKYPHDNVINEKDLVFVPEHFE
jgi:hypothetical protein